MEHNKLGHQGRVGPHMTLIPSVCEHAPLSHQISLKKHEFTISHQSEWLRSKSLQVINAGEGVEKREPSYTVGGNAN